MRSWQALLSVLLALTFVTGKAQPRNLVPNPDFEAHSGCPSWFSMFSLADHWSAPSQGTTDYFNTCATVDSVRVPVNFGGYRPARSGQGYAGFYGYYPSYREYAQVQLLEPLQAGKVYYVHFFVSLSQKLNLPIHNVGAYFSLEPPTNSYEPYLLSLVTQAPQIRNPPDRLLDRTLEWMKIEGSFTAQGGEQYLTIGNFDPDSLTHQPDSLVRSSYYYLEDVSVSDCPLLTDLGPDRVLCPGDSLLLDAGSPGASYRWQDGSLSSTRLVKEPGTYWVEVSLPDCQLRDSIVVGYLDPQPGPWLADVKLCPDQSFVLLNAGYPGATGYTWQDGSTSPLRRAEPGRYWVDIQFTHCSFRDSVVVLPADPLASELTWYVPVCDGQPKVLDVTLKGATRYLWPDGSTLPTYTVTQTGMYSVTIERDNCSFVWYTNVVYSDPLELFDETQLVYCPGETVKLDPGPTLYEHYTWEDGSSAPTREVAKAGLYWVEVTLNSGCKVRDSVRVLFHPEAPHPLPRQVSLCQGETLLLDASSLPGPYQWSNGSSGSRLRVSQSGEYWVEVRWGDCLVRETTQVRVHSLLLLELKGDSLPCYGDSQVLEAVSEHAFFRWSDGSSGSQLTIQQPGIYWVEATDQLTGCRQRDTLRVSSKECWVNWEIPNIITPNGDPHNQTFFIEGLTDHWGLEIFNRWGGLVYQVSSYQNDWDGQGQRNGVYYYLLRNRVSGQRYQSWLQVLR